jgi:hypothetical protein
VLVLLLPLVCIASYLASLAVRHGSAQRFRHGRWRELLVDSTPRRFGGFARSVRLRVAEQLLVQAATGGEGLVVGVDGAELALIGLDDAVGSTELPIDLCMLTAMARDRRCRARRTCSSSVRCAACLLCRTSRDSQFFTWRGYSIHVVPCSEREGRTTMPVGRCLSWTAFEPWSRAVPPGPPPVLRARRAR